MEGIDRPLALGSLMREAREYGVEDDITVGPREPLLKIYANSRVLISSRRSSLFRCRNKQGLRLVPCQEND